MWYRIPTWIVLNTIIERGTTRGQLVSALALQQMNRQTDRQIDKWLKHIVIQAEIEFCRFRNHSRFLNPEFTAALISLTASCCHCTGHHSIMSASTFPNGKEYAKTQNKILWGSVWGPRPSPRSPKLPGSKLKVIPLLLDQLPTHTALRSLSQTFWPSPCRTSSCGFILEMWPAIDRHFFTNHRYTEKSLWPCQLQRVVDRHELDLLTELFRCISSTITTGAVSDTSLLVSQWNIF